MSNVALQIGGRSYTVACPEGEEPHISALGRMIDEKVQAIGTGHSEVRQLLFAALFLADELHDARANGAGPATSADSQDHSAVLETIAERLEKCAAALEG